MRNPTETLRIKSIKVVALFGLYDHHVVLKDDRVTVIHGPNGVGKTVFLKLIDAFMRGRYHEIARVSFDTFEILFDNDSIARIRVEGDSGSRKIHLTVVNSEGNEESSILQGELLNLNRLAQQASESLPFFTQVGLDEWIDRRTEEVIGPEEILERAEGYAPKEAKRLTTREPKGLRGLRGRISVHLIEAQRLIKLSNISPEWKYRASPERPTINTVQEYSKDLKRKLETTLANYAKESQRLDQTFPQRLLSQGIESPLSIDQLKTKMGEVEATRERLKKIGILDEEGPAQGTYPLEILQLDAIQQWQLSPIHGTR